MILKGNQRAFGSDLASHLLNRYENDEAELVEIRGSAARDLHGAFAEFEATASGTRCKEMLYSLSINPSEPMSRQQYSIAIERIENKLGLDNQPRAIVFHDKGGREHCHVVWSRIDVEKMKAVQLSHDRQKLRSVARKLAQEFGHQLPHNLAKNRGSQRFDSGGTQVNVTELAQSEQSGLKADDRRKEITDAYRSSSNAQEFRDALEERGYFLAQGDKRGFVVLDKSGQVHSLPRQIIGAKTKDVREKLKPLTPENLPSVKEVRKHLNEEIEDEALDEKIELALKRSPEELKQRQTERRLELQVEQQKLELVQRDERMKLHVAQKQEREKPFARAAMAVFGVIEQVPVLRTVLMPLMKNTSLNVKERHRQQNEAIERRYKREHTTLERKDVALQKVERREGKSLARDQRRIKKAETQRDNRRNQKEREVHEFGKELTDRQKEVMKRMEEKPKTREHRPRKPRGFTPD